MKETISTASAIIAVMRSDMAKKKRLKQIQAASETRRKAKKDELSDAFISVVNKDHPVMMSLTLIEDADFRKRLPVAVRNGAILCKPNRFDLKLYETRM